MRDIKNSLSLKRLSAKQKDVITSIVLFAAAAGLLSYGSVGIVQKEQATSGTANIVSVDAVVSNSTQTPQEQHIDAATYPATPADMPRSIDMPTIATTGFLQKVGVDQSNAVAVPTNIFLGGWYVNSAKPGDKGVSLIAGHVQGVYKNGLFKKLGKLQRSDVFHVLYGDGTRRSFTVQSVTDYSSDEAGKKMLEPVSDIERQLNLITCAGAYNSQTKQYEKRTIVVARANL